MKWLFQILFLLVPFLASAQDISGFWKGTLNMTGGCFPVNHIELQLTVSGDSVTGASYHFSDVNNYVKKRVSGHYNKTTKKLYLRESDVTTFKIPSHCKICVKNFDLSYSRAGDREVLTGGWTGKILGTETSCESNGITLSRMKESAFKEIPEILVDTGQIRLDFYDNGEIDGDSITVLVNNQVIISHQKLSAKPITSYVRVDLQHPFQEVEMVAENLGSIPPNTALLIITAGTRRYQLFLTSTATKSAQVRFLYEKPPPLPLTDAGNLPPR